MRKQIAITGPKCISCGDTGAVSVTPSEAAALAAGAPVHQALADHPRDAREMLISGTHPSCWETLFGPAEEDLPPWDLN